MSLARAGRGGQHDHVPNVRRTTATHAEPRDAGASRRRGDRVPRGRHPRRMGARSSTPARRHSRVDRREGQLGAELPGGGIRRPHAGLPPIRAPGAPPRQVRRGGGGSGGVPHARRVRRPRQPGDRPDPVQRQRCHGIPRPDGPQLGAGLPLHRDRPRRPRPGDRGGHPPGPAPRARRGAGPAPGDHRLCLRRRSHGGACGQHPGALLRGDRLLPAGHRTAPRPATIRGDAGIHRARTGRVHGATAHRRGLRRSDRSGVVLPRRRPSRWQVRGPPGSLLRGGQRRGGGCRGRLLERARSR